MSNWTDRNDAARPQDDHMDLLKRGDERMDNLLYDLLVDGGPHGHEHRIKATLLKFFEECGIDIGKDSKIISVDGFGNLHVDLRTDLLIHKTLFSAHMDTMHPYYMKIDLYATNNRAKCDRDLIYASKPRYTWNIFDLKNPKKKITDWQRILDDAGIEFYRIDASKDSTTPKGMFRLNVLKKVSEWDKNPKDVGVSFYGKKEDTKIQPAILGADDKVGCWLLCQLIKAKTPAYYIFHCAEECGCQGSRWIYANKKEWLKNSFDKCVAFDRKGYTDVISQMRVGRTASREFSEALADQLNISETLPPLKQYKGEITGMFTDSGVYEDVIAECTNISCGYFNEHTTQEHFDLYWLRTMMLPAVLALQWDSLPIKRDPVKPVYHAPVNRYPHETPFYGRQQSHLVGGSFEDVSKVCLSTAPHRIPPWEPDDGLLEKATPEGMKVILLNYYNTILLSTHDRKDFLYQMICTQADLADHVVALRQAVDGGADEEIIVEAQDDNTLNDDPNGFPAIKEPAIEELFPIKNNIIIKCDVCKKWPKKCQCTDAEKKAWDMLHAKDSPVIGTNAPDMLINELSLIVPRRENYISDALFQGAMTAYLERTKNKPVATILANPDIRERLER